MTDDPDHPSTPGLIDRVGNFMNRAEEILDHPLAGTVSSFKINIQVNRETGEVVGADFDNNPADKASWAYLALLLRPVVFNEKDDISIAKLTGAIQREHESLRKSKLKLLRSELQKWRNTPMLSLQDLGPVPDEEPLVTSVWTGPVGTLPEGVDMSEAVYVYEYADIYFNGKLWHADTVKALQYDHASPIVKAHMLKCAEIRTLSAVHWVRQTHDWIIGARGAGWDF